MPPEKPERNPLSDDMNIRPPEERYGGQGHAGENPYKEEDPGKRDEADSPVEIPDADLEDLIEVPDGPPGPYDGRVRNG